MERALYVGRFQPHHNGHQSVIEQINRNPDVDEIVIGVGSSQYGNFKFLDNPFDYETRKLMLMQATVGMKPTHIIPIPDIHDPSWVQYVEVLCPKFNLVYSGNPIVKKMFEQSGYNVIAPETTQPISATLIRQRMIRGENWQEFVPPTTLQILEQVRGSERLRFEYLKHPRANNTADLIIQYQDMGIVLITRGNEPFANFLALPGGYLNVGFETLEQAAAREAKEETGLEINPQKLHLLGVYSAPQRDPRGSTISACYYAKIDHGDLKAGDDAKQVHLMNPGKLPRLAFDHNKMIEDLLSRGLN